MPYANNNGIRIHYQVCGEGQPLVLQHWSLATLEDWHDHGYVSALENDYRLILLDARGHGKSDKPRDLSAYALKERVGDIVSVLDDLEIAQAHFCGYSMGGWIGFGVARYAPERFRSVVIGGAHPYAQSMAELRGIIKFGIENGAEACTAAWEETHGWISSKERMLSNDYDALMAVAQDRESQEHLLSKINIPCLLYAGDADEGVYPLARKCFEAIPDATFVALPGLDHGDTIRRSDAVVPHIRKFLSTVSQ